MTGPQRMLPVAALGGLVGQELGVSDWISIPQERIDLFAEATLDDQFIHVDPARAGSTVFGGTIAHGFLVLSLLTKMASDALPKVQGMSMAVNYGLNKVRFVSPVGSSKRVRGRFTLRDAVEKESGCILCTYAVTVELEDCSKPALIAEWLGLVFISRDQPKH